MIKSELKSSLTGLTRLTGKPLSVYTYGTNSDVPVNLVKGVKNYQKSSHNPLFHRKSRCLLLNKEPNNRRGESLLPPKLRGGVPMLAILGPTFSQNQVNPPLVPC